MARASPTRSFRVPRHQRGVILFVALLATIALTMAGVALDRAVGTDVAIVANLAMRTHATLAASTAIERAVAALFESGGIADYTTDDLPHNYFAARQAGEDVRRVPRALQSPANFPAEAAVIDNGDGYILRHVIERLCLLPGSPTVDRCTLTPPSVAAAAGTPGASEPPRTPCYRVTVRVDGPAGTAAFVQALLGEESSHHRLSWRVLDD